MFTRKQLESIGFRRHENHWRALNHWHSKEKVYIVGGTYGLLANNAGKARVLIRGRYLFFLRYEKWSRLTQLRQQQADSTHKLYFEELWSNFKLPLFSESGYALKQLQGLLQEVEEGHHHEFFYKK